MNNFLKNILLLIVSLSLSYYASVYFGAIYDNLTPGSLGDDAWVGSTRAWQSVIGLPFAYIFFTVLLFKLFAAGDRNKWTAWLLVPAFLFFASGDLKYIYLPIILALISLVLATMLRKILKIKHN